MFQVLATSGDTKTGGMDIDNAVLNYLLQSYSNTVGIDVTSDRMAMTRLERSSRESKEELSTIVTTDVDLPFIATNASGPKNFHHTLTRAKLEELATPIVERIREPLRKALC